MLAPRLVFVVLCIAFAPRLATAAYFDLGLRPRWSDEALEAADHGMRERLAAIDAIEEPWLAGAPLSDSLRVELVRLYRGSPLMKHRVRALELLSDLPPEPRLRESILTYRRTFNPWDAEQSVEKWQALAPDTARPHRWQGMLQFQEAMIGLRPELLAQSIESFRRATAAPDAELEDWRGLAAALVAARRHAALRPVAESMLELAPDDVGANLFAALANEAAGLTNRAAAEFEKALELMDGSLASRFRSPHRLVVHESVDVLGSGLVVPEAPDVDRGWWVRLLESEVLFGDPDARLHAWDSAPGTAYLLFGRPVFMRGFRWAGTDDILATPELSPYHDEIVRQMGSTRAGPDLRYWVWLVRTADRRLDPLVFGQFTRFARWEPSVVAEVEMIEPAARRGPQWLASSLPPVVERDASVDLHLLSTGFRTSLGQMRIESWVATHAERASTARAVRMRLLDASGAEIDRVQRALDVRYERRSLGAQVRGFPTQAPGWIHGFGAIVTEGEFLVIVDVLDGEGEVMASRDRRLRFDAKEGAAPASTLRLSPALLCDAYSELGDFDHLPPEFVRHARAVVPHPEPELYAGQQVASVYYEVYGATLDAQGLTSLDVEYELYAERAFDPYVLGAGYVDGELQLPAFRAVFPDERTGAAGGGLVIKGTRFEVGDLQPGPHVLVIRVGDRITRQEATTLLRFGVPVP